MMRLKVYLLKTFDSKLKIIKLMKTIFTFIIMMSSFCYGQNTRVLDHFFELLTSQNLKPKKTLLLEKDSNSVIVKSYLGNEYDIIKFNMSNLERIQWTTKEEYNDIYPEDSLTNKDSKDITLWFKKGTVEHDNYFISNDKKEYIGKYGEKNIVSKCINCDYVNFSFINSNLAGKAKRLLDIYVISLKE
jgi:hypothetical protein